MPTSSSIAAIDPGLPSDPIVRPKVIWKTRQIALDINDRELYVKLTIKELVAYVVFFVIFFTSCSSLYSYETFVVNREISSLFVEPTFSTYSDNDYDVSLKFDDIITMSHFWQYFHSVLCDKLYEIPTGVEKENGTELLYENKFLFRPRVRQVRVEEGHCAIRNQFKGLFQDCYVPYDTKYEDKTSFGPKKGTPWVHSDGSKTQGVFYQGEIASYGPGGFYFDFPKNKIDAKTKISDLEHDTWLNRGTRAVFVDFAIYNCNINVVCAVKLVFEFPASGGIVSSSSFRTVKLYRYAVADSVLTLIGMLAAVGFIIYFTVEEVFEIMYFKKDYIYVFWNYIDFSIVALGWWAIGVALMILFKERSLSGSSPKSAIAKTVTNRMSVEFLVARHENLVTLTAYLFFFVCVKVIKYTDLNRSMTIVYLSVGRCFKIVAGYLVIMVFVVSAFATLGYFAFGAQVKGFSTMYDSVLSSLRILMRDFDYRTLQDADAWFTTFFFVFFTCVVIFVLLTMLVAIVFHAYFDVDVEQSLEGRQPYVSDKVSAFVDRIIAKIGFNKWAEKRRSDRLKDELDRRITYQDVYKTLKRCGFTNSEVEKILNKYGIEPQKTVHEDEARQMFRDVLKNDQELSNKDIEDNTGGSDIKWLIKRVDLLENALDDVHKKCDIVIARLDAIRVKLPSNYAEQNLKDNPS
ncbi:polycystin-2-like [Aphis gossypii]|uniref:polycystin-2-like n=1 Tax=Aphis gossypii TaxID=80765 RepID=UPI0021595924|nr:polycystin-2-like [Aphis gossypii]